MTPAPWTGLLLALAAYRITRLIGWDDLPPIQKTRDWLTGAHVERSSVADVVAGAPERYWAYRRPLLQHFLHCAFCLGFWISLAVYLAWVFEPSWTRYGAVPFAISAFVGLVAKSLDP